MSRTHKLKHLSGILIVKWYNDSSLKCFALEPRNDCIRFVAGFQCEMSERERELGVVNISLAVHLRGGENAVCTLQKLRSEQIAIGNIT